MTASPTAPAALAPVFVSPADVAALLVTAPLPTAPEVRLLEVRRDPDDPGAARSHLPGAVVADLATDLADPLTSPASGRGRRPLPAPEVLERTLRRWGVRGSSTVVVYDAVSGLVAARAWWVLRWAGLTRVSILDGGVAAWTQEGRPTAALAGEPPEGDVVVRPGQLPEVDAAAAARLAGEHRLLDARGATAYREGHIPGARHVASTDALDAAGRLRPDHELRELYGVGDAAAPVPALSCGGGVAGAFGVAVLAHLGRVAPLYVGSFSAWSADPARPVATGGDPDGETP